MSEIQFDYNPLTPVPPGGGKFPWGTLLIGLGLFTLLVTLAYLSSKPEVDYTASTLDRKSLKPDHKNQESEKQSDNGTTD